MGGGRAQAAHTSLLGVGGTGIPHGEQAPKGNRSGGPMCPGPQLFHSQKSALRCALRRAAECVPCPCGSTYSGGTGKDRALGLGAQGQFPAPSASGYGNAVPEGRGGKMGPLRPHGRRAHCTRVS